MFIEFQIIREYQLQNFCGIRKRDISQMSYIRH